MSKTITSKKWLTPTDLFKEYGFGLSNQSKLRSKGKIPFSRVGRYIRYNRSTIDQWLENNSVDVRV